MKVSKLIKELSKYPSDTEVIVSSDAEGNQFNKLNDVGAPENYRDRFGEIEFLDDEDIKDGMKPKGKAIVLWPN